MYGSYFVAHFDHPERVQIIMSGERLRYFSYLLRLWQTSERDTQVWRASLDNPGTRERLGFENLEDLCEFLHKQLDADDGDMNNSENHKQD